jgi:LuxR family maltose regulon positive regulatory protein
VIASRRPLQRWAYVSWCDLVRRPIDDMAPYNGGMATPLLATKLYRPRPRQTVVRRLRLLAQLRAGLDGPLTLLSAPAGFGKTTLLADGLADCSRPVAWLSLEEGDGDLPRFLTYLVAALQTVDSTTGAHLQGLLGANPPSAEFLLTALVNDLAARQQEIVLVLDDYHRAASPAVEQALTFLLEHLPTQLHLVLATREDPALPLARLRARGELTELRLAALRFTAEEAGAFLKQSLGLSLTTGEVAILETRTEGWIAGLQLAGLSLQGQTDPGRFLEAFGGSSQFVLDYLAEEVLQRQPERVQQFLLGTAILERLCGPLCEAVLLVPAGTGQATLEELERENLFVVPLDEDRRWYRYHQLFAELLRQRLRRRLAAAPSGQEAAGAGGIAGVESESELHRRASEWYEAKGLELEAFEQAVAAQDNERAARLMEGKGMPLHFRGAIAPVLSWLKSLPRGVLDARPSLWVMYASALSMTNDLTGVEEKLKAAEAALEGAEQDETTRNLIGHIAAIRALLAATQYQADIVIAQSQLALEYLRPDNLPVRTATVWKLGWAYLMQGDRAAASQALSEAIALSKASGNTVIYLSALVGLGAVQEAELQLALAAETYQQALQQTGDLPRPGAGESHLGLARISYEWNDLAAAERHGQTGLQLTKQVESTDRYLVSEVFLARLQLARGDSAGAAARLAAAAQSARQHQFAARLPEIAAAQVVTWLRQGHPAAAAQLAASYEDPLSRARVHLAHGDTAEALAVLGPWREEVEARGWPDARLQELLLEGLARWLAEQREQAVETVTEALALAEPAGCVRSFVDEGPVMAELLTEVAARGILPEYMEQLLAACAMEQEREEHRLAGSALAIPVLVEPLSRREEEVLRLIAQGLSNQEIAERLVVALDTVKGHNQKIFSKLQVQRRTEAVARARELGLL